MKRKIKNAIITAVLFLGCTSITETAFAETKNIYRWVREEKVEVAVSVLNVRTGAGFEFPAIGTVKEGDVLDVLGAMGNWYVVCLSDGSIGVISRDCVRIYSLRNLGEGDSGIEFEAEYHEEAESDAAKLFNLINDARRENSLEPYAWNDELNMIARIKARDMEENNYFSHYSQLYGTPFTMLKRFDISYRSATENIIGNISVESAFMNIMADPVYRGNILNTKYEKVGIGIIESVVYGKIIVQIFIQE